MKIIYEDNHLLVVEKPVNVLSQGDETGDADMLTILKDDIKKRFDKPGEVYLGLVHRLDRPVGGVMVFAKTSKAASRLSEQVRLRNFKKTYMAIVHGLLNDKTGRLQHYLIKDSRTNTVKSVSKSTEGAKEAILEYKVIAEKEDLSLVEIDLHTGRSHQIRVQFSETGHPLFGDQKYGQEHNKPGQQLALWSAQIIISHPTLKEQMKFECLPPDEHPWNMFKIKL